MIRSLSQKVSQYVSQRVCRFSTIGVALAFLMNAGCCSWCHRWCPNNSPPATAQQCYPAPQQCYPPPAQQCYPAPPPQGFQRNPYCP